MKTYVDIAGRIFDLTNLDSEERRLLSRLKRLANRWQASATYTLLGLWEAESPPFTGDRATNRFIPVPFPTAPDMGAENTLSVADQRHHAVFNGIWEVGRGFLVSGLFYHGSGIRDASFYGGDERQTGADFSQRLRPDGTIGVLYYDFRNDTGDPSTLRCDVWLVTSTNGSDWTERHVAGPFDMRRAPVTPGGLFVGDYQALTSASGRFIAFFTQAAADAANPTDIWASVLSNGDATTFE